MTAFPDPVARELEAHDAFEPADNDTYRLTTTVFEATVIASDAEGKRDGEFTVTVSLPTLDAAVANEAVASVVEDGWFETLERRLEDVFSVAHTYTRRSYRRTRHRVGHGHARVSRLGRCGGRRRRQSLIEFVEGTYAQGIIPGYKYRGAAATLLENAQTQGQDAAEGDDPNGAGGMPM